MQTCYKSKPAESPNFVDNSPFLYFIYLNFHDFFFQQLNCFFLCKHIYQKCKTIVISEPCMIHDDMAKSQRQQTTLAYQLTPTLVSVVTADRVQLMLCVRRFLASYKTNGPLC